MGRKMVPVKPGFETDDRQESVHRGNGRDSFVDRITQLYALLKQHLFFYGLVRIIMIKYKLTILLCGLFINQFNHIHAFQN